MYICKKVTNLWSLVAVAQKICLPRPWEAQNGFGGKSILNVASDVKVGGKLINYEYIDLWKFGVDISNHFWVIQNQPNTIFHHSPPNEHFVHLDVWNAHLEIQRDQWNLVNFELLKSGLRYLSEIFTICSSHVCANLMKKFWPLPNPPARNGPFLPKFWTALATVIVEIFFRK